MFDWIPTADEVFRKVNCTLTDHEWVIITDGNDVFLYYECEECGKRKE